jgi:hypothetical protein
MPSPIFSRAGLVPFSATMLAFFVGCGSHETPPPAVDTPTPASKSAAPATAAPVQIEMKNVRLYLDDGIVLNVRSLRGEMVSPRSGLTV